ncbi:MAG: prepilin-type N-terminal cleavage/methylation domain-containing protein [Planctomycetota bacterium]
MQRVALHHRAFSLIELVVVMAILGVVAAIAVPKLSSAAAGQRAEMAALRLSTDLAMVQEMARAQSRSITVTFDAAARSYAIKGDTTSVVSLAREPYGVSAFQASFGDSGVTELTADGYGRWTAAGEAKVYAGDRMVLVAVAEETVVAGSSTPVDPGAAAEAGAAAAAPADQADPADPADPADSGNGNGKKKKDK